MPCGSRRKPILPPPLPSNTGAKAEALAANFLTNLGCQLIEQNLHTRFGEIDLIVQDRETLIYVEVKYRRSTYIARPEEFVTKTKLQKLELAIKHYQKKHQLTGPQRLDVIGISGDLKTPQIHHFKNIFLSDYL